MNKNNKIIVGVISILSITMLVAYFLVCINPTTHHEEIPRCILEKTTEVALTYDPYFIEYWHEDVENPELQDIFENTSVALNSSVPVTLSFSPGIYANRVTDAVLKNPYVEGVLLSVRWRNIEPSRGKYNWDALDSRINVIAKAGKSVVLNVMTCGVSVPDWIINDPEVETFEFVDLMKYHPTYGKVFKVPLYWDEKYLSEKQKFINKLGERYANNPAVGGVMVSFVGTFTNDWYIPRDRYEKGDCLAEQELLDKGYSTDRMFEVGKRTIDIWANAFPKQALKLPIGKSIAEGNNTITTLAEKVLDYAYSKYPDRFYAQINALSTIIPKANSSKVQNATPDSIFYLLKLLSQHPRHIGFQMISSVTKDPERVDNAGCVLLVISNVFLKMLVRV